MTRHDKQLNVRMAHENIDGLKKAAAENRRSLTAQLNTIVEEWLKQNHYCSSLQKMRQFDCIRQ